MTRQARGIAALATAAIVAIAGCTGSSTPSNDHVLRVAMGSPTQAYGPVRVVLSPTSVSVRAPLTPSTTRAAVRRMVRTHMMRSLQLCC